MAVQPQIHLKANVLISSDQCVFLCEVALNNLDDYNKKKAKQISLKFIKTIFFWGGGGDIWGFY